jgi:hypothetical protein
LNCRAPTADRDRLWVRPRCSPSPGNDTSPDVEEQPLEALAPSPSLGKSRVLPWPGKPNSGRESGTPPWDAPAPRAPIPRMPRLFFRCGRWRRTTGDARGSRGARGAPKGSFLSVPRARRRGASRARPPVLELSEFSSLPRRRHRREPVPPFPYLLGVVEARDHGRSVSQAVRDAVPVDARSCNATLRVSRHPSGCTPTMDVDDRMPLC